MPAFHYLHANEPEKLIAELLRDHQHLNDSVSTDKEWYERVQLAEFLKAAAREPFITYPITIIHTSDSNPDFKIDMPSQAVGVEVSRITNEPLHRLEKVPKIRNSVTTPSPFLISGRKLRNDEIFDMALNSDTWNAPEAEQAFWFQQAQDIVRKKSKIRRRNDYHDYGKNWLVLWDRLSISPAAFHSRAELLQKAWNQFWRKHCGFDLIVLECEELRRFAILTPDGIHFLPEAVGAM